MERRIYPAAVLYVAFNVLSVTLRTVVGQQGYTCHHRVIFHRFGSSDVIGYMTI